MPARLLDTNIVSYMVKQHRLLSLYTPHITGFDLRIAVQTLAELSEGATLANWGQVRWKQLESTLAPMGIYDANQDVAAWWAWVRVVRRARPIGLADCWIAATALTYGLDLVTHNPADFAGIPGLAVISEAP